VLSAKNHDLGSLRKIQKSTWIFIAAVFLGSFLHSFTSVKYSAGDVQDEIVYMDYLVKASHFELGQFGDRYSEETVDEICWRNGQLDHPSVPLDYSEQCNAEDPAAAFGANTGGTPKPVYFVVTGVVSRVIDTALSLFGLDVSVVTIARTLGGAWFGLGGILTFLIVRRLGECTDLVGPLCLGVAGLQSVIHEHTIINADTSSFALGALLVLVTLRFIQGASKLPMLLGTGVLVGLATNHHLVILCACTAFLFFSIFTRGEKTNTWTISRNALKGFVAVLAAAVFTVIGYGKVALPLLRGILYGAPDTDTTQVSLDLAQSYATTGFQWFRTFSAENMTRFFVPHADNFLPAQRIGGPYQTAAWLMYLLLTGGVIAALLLTHDNPVMRKLAGAHCFAALVMPVVFVTYWNWNGVNDGVQGRFGLSGLSILVITSSFAFADRKMSRYIVWCVCGLTFVAAGLTNFVDFV
jgi:hypothetical protein